MKKDLTESMKTECTDQLISEINEKMKETSAKGVD